MVVGSACFDDGRTRMYAYVHRQVQSAAARLDRFLQESDVDKERRVTIVADGAGEFEMAVRGGKTANVPSSGLVSYCYEIQSD